MKKLFYSLLLITLANLLSAQSRYNLTGTMVDSLNNERVQFATIMLLTPDSTAQMVGKSLSDAQGKFQISNVLDGEYQFVATLVGYERLIIPVTVGGNSKTIDLGDIPMHKNSTDLQEVQILGEKPV